MRVSGKEEGNGGKGMAMGTRAASERTDMLTKRAMAIKTREAGKKEGNSKGSKSNGNGQEDGNCKQQQRQPQ